MNPPVDLSSVTVTKPVINYPRVGDILVSLGAYETIFYKVKKVNKKTVQIVEIESNNFNYTCAGMNWESVPRREHEIVGTIVTKTLKSHGNSFKLKRHKYSSIFPWSGKLIKCHNHH